MTTAKDPRPTLNSVARAANVSRQTVSNALNNPERVSPETLAHVQRHINELGYRPNLAARQLRTRKSRIIGMRLQNVTDGINGVVLDRFLHALVERSQADGYRVLLFTASDDGDEIDRSHELQDSSNVDGFVLTSTHHDDARLAWFKDHAVPFVTFGRQWDASRESIVSSHSWVDVDGAAGTSAAVTHLVERGHRLIAFVGWPPGSGIGDERRVGWTQRMAAFGLADNASQLVIATTDGVNEGANAMRSLLDRPAAIRPSAVVCASDSLALGAMQLARQRSVDMAIIGFDDTPVAAATGMSSVAQPLDMVAQEVLRILRRQFPDADGIEPPLDHVLLTPDLVVRESTSSRV